MSITTTHQISRTIRFASMLVDHFVMTLVAVVFGLPLFTLEIFSDINSNPFTGFADSMGPLEYISYIGFAIYFCKDSLHGRSFAKRLFRLQVVNKATGKTAGPLRCFVRNIFCILWPIEVLVSWFNTGRRLGDRVAGTQLTVYDKNKVDLPFKTGQIVLSIVAAYIFMLALMYGIYDNVIAGSGKRTYVKSSYDAAASRKMEKFFADSLEYPSRSRVRIYDSTTNGAAHYIFLEVRLKSNYLKDSGNKRKMIERIKNLVYRWYDADSLQGNVEIVYREIGHVESQRVDIGKYKSE